VTFAHDFERKEYSFFATRASLSDHEISTVSREPTTHKACQDC